ncbi:MAG: hypothetical protein P8Y64_01720 [Gammaproteobacteria bacterium]|jgi:hypothetical protein
MYPTMLPDAVEHERETMMESAIDMLKARGYRHFSAHELPGFEEPGRVTIRVLNVPMTPDIFADGVAGLQPLLAVVETATDLGEELPGRRWQAFAEWAEAHGARLKVYVHPDDLARARTVADHWHLDPGLVEALPTRH